MEFEARTAFFDVLWCFTVYSCIYKRLEGAFSVKEILKAHISRYPLSRPRDMVKLIYQSEYGGGHLLTDRGQAETCLLQELKQVQCSSGEPVEEIGGDLCRLHLRALNSLEIRPSTCAGLFALACRPRGTAAGMEEKLQTLVQLTEAGETHFSPESLSAYITEWRNSGMPAVSHSEAYREAYHPAYRLIERYGARHLSLLSIIDRTVDLKGCCTVKIDGRCASGKSTLGQYLFDIYSETASGAQLFHMDDYYVPWAQKTPSRLAEPGGNVDWERFLQEVDSVPLTEPVRYRRFNCETQALEEETCVSPASVRIIEGSYSLNPNLPAPDISVFLTVDPSEQRQRILRRNGPEALRRFDSDWIPLEEKYISACGVQKKCDLTFDHTDL